ncbi:MAG TPA: tryptophan 2,3-dioxygenase family protein [Polyangiaceae bacterium]|nr:tryptophan 2,3-dioxygenase family protein [Polyangiaceae bacterium]
MALTYGRYLHLPELLGAQEPLSEGPEHDEMLFIVVHQVYELWFKQMLHEARFLQRVLEQNDTHHALSTLKRMLTILKTLVSQVDVLETMTPMSFSAFRTRLETASGFQSVQFRELEFVLGHKREGVLAHYPEGSEERALLEAALPASTVWDSFLGFLHGQGFEMPEEALRRDPREPVRPTPAVQAVLLRVYRQDALLSQVCERLVDLDEGLQEWRYRHVKMVERTIGAKAGSGGSSGVAYLQSTLFRSLFPDLWEIRARL